MKKMMTNIRTLAALLIASATFVAFVGMMFIKGKKLGLKDRKEMEELRQEQAEYGDNYVFHLPNRNLKTSISLLLCPYILP